MTISGFTFVKNTAKFYYPFVESILSILPIVDEFVILVGDCDPEDTTLAQIESIQSDKIKIHHTTWDREAFEGNSIYAQQTDMAKAYCTGDWLFYLQSDEVVHEKYLPVIQKACEHYLDNPKIEGLLFKYRHFWGDFDHYHHSHGWYKHEIRIIKNRSDIHSWRDAQSFRVIPHFDGKSYMSKEGSRKLNVAKIDAYIYHYGWVRPPQIMKMKKSNDGDIVETNFDYGPLDALSLFTETHPMILHEWIKKFDWSDELYEKAPKDAPILHKHQKPRVKLLTKLEGLLYKHEDEIGGFKNYNVVDTFKA